MKGLLILIHFIDLLLVSIADTMVSCSALHAILFTATSNVLCHELCCLIKYFNAALAHLRVPEIRVNVEKPADFEKMRKSKMHEEQSPKTLTSDNPV